MNRAPAAVLAALAVIAGACGTHRVRLPDGAGVPVPDADARAVLAQAGGECGQIGAMSAVADIAGSIRGQRARGRLLIGTASPASIRLELMAPFGQPLFIFVSRAGQASLLLPREDRILAKATDYEVLEAVAGVPLETAELRAVLLGCVEAVSAADMRAYGSGWRSARTAEADMLYYARPTPTAPWYLVAWVSGGRPGRPQRWRAEFSERDRGVPRQVGLYSERAGQFALQFTLSDVELNGALSSEVFELRASASASPVTLEEVRRSGPMAEQDDRGR